MTGTALYKNLRYLLVNILVSLLFFTFSIYGDDIFTARRDVTPIFKRSISRHKRGMCQIMTDVSRCIAAY